MVDQRPTLGPAQHHFALLIVFGLPDQSRSFGNENGQYPAKLRIQRAKFFRLGMFGFVADGKVAQRNLVFARTSMHAPGKVPSQLAQSLLAQRCIRKKLVSPSQSPPLVCPNGK